MAAVTAVTQNAARVKTVHSRPALLQELEWRPRYMPAALLKKRADDEKAAAETTRSTNKKTFRP